MADIGDSVAIVGTGPLGLLAGKNLLEQGFKVTFFTKDESIGGLWNISDDVSKLTVLEQTTINTSRHGNCASDYPMPYDWPTHPSARQLLGYWADYADHFHLIRRVRFGERVNEVSRNESDTSWLVQTMNVNTGKQQTSSFDRVVLANGALSKPNIVKLQNQDVFQGEVIHSIEFKDPNRYQGKNVIVVGCGSTAADLLVFLKQADAKTVYMSHRTMFNVLPRMTNGVAFDHQMTYRAMSIIRYLASWSTTLAGHLMGMGLSSGQAKAFPYLKDHPSWKPPHKPGHPFSRLPTINDALPAYLRDREIEAITGIKQISGPHSVTLTDGRRIDNLDAIIMCTGYSYDHSILRGKGDPFDPTYAPDNFRRLEAAAYNPRNEHLPRLYRGIISEQYPHSLAILGHFIALSGAFALNDLVTMALAALWSGSYPMPSPQEMRRDIDAHYNFVCSVVEKRHYAMWGFRVDVRDTWNWMNEVAGTGIVERLGGWGWEGWKFWWTENRLYKLCMNGVNTPAVLRLFDTGRGRKPWAGARDSIEKINAQVDQMRADWQEKQRAAKMVKAA